MRDSFALFGFLVALNMLVTVGLLTHGFQFNKLELVDFSRDLFLKWNQINYLALLFMLLCDAILWGYKKWTSRK